MQEQHSNTSSSNTMQSTAWKCFLIYDAFMMVLIVINLVCLGLNAFFLSSFGGWLFGFLKLSAFLQFYREQLSPWVDTIDSWFISYLVIELLVRWFVAIVRKHHKRWFFFPFIHWYEILAIIPQLRFLRLLRAGVIAYRLHQMGFKVVPDNIRRKLVFYYRVIMEELSDRVVLTVLDGVKYELTTSSSHKKIIHDLVDHHRQLFTVTLAELLQESLAKGLREQQPIIADYVGKVVIQSIEDTPELTQLLRLFPLVGNRIEQQIQSIGQRLGENISVGLIQPFTEGSSQHPNPAYQLIANEVGEININNHHLEQLVESVVFESMEAIRKQVQVKQWHQMMDEHEPIQQNI